MIREMILKQIEYECMEGIHTYHTCIYCGMNPTRGERCAECWRKILTIMDERIDQDEIDEPDAVDGC
jgi:hypothetical protein